MHCLALTCSRDKRAVSFPEKHWPQGHAIRISFMGVSADRQALIKKWAAEWLPHINLSYEWAPEGGQVRIATMEGAGAWSYIGTDATRIAKDQPTMNFGFFDRPTVLHEFGHMLGFGHEHQNPQGGIKWNKAILQKDLSGPPNNWDADTIARNVLEAYSVDRVRGTRFDSRSIMLYPIPSRWTLDGLSTKANTELSEQDKAYAASVYPRAVTADYTIDQAKAVYRKVFRSESDYLKLGRTVMQRIAPQVGIGDLIGLKSAALAVALYRTVG